MPRSRNPLTKSQLRSTPAIQWLDAFVCAPSYDAEWCATRTAALLNLVHAAACHAKKELPSPQVATVLRHRVALLPCLPIAGVMAVMTPKEITEPLRAEDGEISEEMAQAMNPPADAFIQQSTPTPQRLSPAIAVFKSHPKPANATQRNQWG